MRIDWQFKLCSSFLWNSRRAYVTRRLCFNTMGALAQKRLMKNTAICTGGVGDRQAVTIRSPVRDWLPNGGGGV